MAVAAAANTEIKTERCVCVCERWNTTEGKELEMVSDCEHGTHAISHLAGQGRSPLPPCRIIGGWVCLLAHFTIA